MQNYMQINMYGEKQQGFFFGFFCFVILFWGFFPVFSTTRKLKCKEAIDIVTHWNSLENLNKKTSLSLSRNSHSHKLNTNANEQKTHHIWCSTSCIAQAPAWKRKKEEKEEDKRETKWEWERKRAIELKWERECVRYGWVRFVNACNTRLGHVHTPWKKLFGTSCVCVSIILNKSTYSTHTHSNAHKRHTHTHTDTPARAHSLTHPIS